MGGKGSGNKLAYKNARGAKSPVIGDHGLKISDDDMQTLICQAATTTSWEPIDNKDIEQLDNRVNEYIQYCIDNNVRPGNMEFYSVIGIDHRRIPEILAKEPSSPRAAIIKKGINFCRISREKMALYGKINPVTSLFWQKNYDGLKDQQDVVIAPAKQIEADKSPEEIAAELEQDIPIDAESHEIE